MRIHSRAKPVLDWLCGEAVIQGNLVALDRQRSRRCALIADIEVLSAFTRIFEAKDVTTFIRKYGLLLHGPNDREHREQLGEWLHAAEKIRLLVSVNQALRKSLRGDEEGIWELRTYEPEMQVNFLYGRPTDTDDELVVATGEGLAQEISEGLGGVQESVSFDAANTNEGSDVAKNAGRFSFSARIPNLYTLIYYTLANALVISWPTSQCEECRRVFVAADKRQRFCSTTCAGRVRYRRFAAKKKSAQSLLSQSHDKTKAQQR